MDPKRTLELAIKCHQAGDWPRAQCLYRGILAADPRNSDALHLLGVLSGQMGNSDQAVELITRAIEIRPDFADAMGNLGNVLIARGMLDEPIAWYRKAIAISADFHEAHNNLGNALRACGKLEGAIACYRRAIALAPRFAEAHRNLASTLRQNGDVEGAIASLRIAIDLQPKDATTHRQLGNLLQDARQFEQAILSYRQAIALKPDFSAAYANLSSAFREQGKLDEAMDACRFAISLDPNSAAGYNDLGNVLKDAGRIDEAVTAFRQAVAINPNDPKNAGNLILALHYHPSSTPQSLLEECRFWAKRYAGFPAQVILPHTNNRNADRRLRIGYMSPDFRQHVIAIFLLPLLEQHDRGAFEIFCYSHVAIPDHMTASIRSKADHWRSIAGVSDAQVAELIREDRIDILVDLSLHAAGNRLAIFGRKPAPIQVTYLAYCSTSGLEEMDYRMTDPHLDPPASLSSHYSEQSVHLPENYWCYRPVFQVPGVCPLPASTNGAITFGSLNNFCKVNRQVIEVWCRLLQAVPDSNLLLHANPGSHLKDVVDLIESKGIDQKRLRFAAQLPPARYFQLYQSIDIGLDPFPFNGATTTCDALWMRVPVVTLAGQTAVGRAGRSILSNVGLSRLVATNADEYVRIATELAGDLPALVELRRTLRSRMLASPLTNAPRFARNIEAAYRTMWKTWCATDPRFISRRAPAK